MVRDQNGLAELNGSYDNYLGTNITFDLAKPVPLSDLYFDCAGNQITAYTQLFSALSRVMLRNCVFKLEKQFAATVEESTLTNVTILITYSTENQTSVTASDFHGVRIEAASYFFANATESRFVGCAFGIFVQETSESQALIGNMTSCTVQNCYLNASIAVSSQVSAAGLAINANDVLVLKSRFIANITAQTAVSVFNASEQLSGCIANGYKNLTIKDCDFLTSMHVAGDFAAAAGVLATSVSGQSLDFCNLSSHFAYTDDLGGSCNLIANLITYLNATTAELSAISTFNNVQIKYAAEASNRSKEMVVSGVIAQIRVVSMRLADSYAFGNFELDMAYKSEVIAGACVAQSLFYKSNLALIDRFRFSGNINVLTHSGNGNVKVGGLLGQVRNCTLRRSVFYGNLSVFYYAQGMLYIGGMLASKQDDLISYTCIAIVNISIVIYNAAMTTRSGCFGAISESIKNSVVTCNISVVQTEEGDSVIIVGLLSAYLNSEAINCSIFGSIIFKTANALPIKGIVGGVAASSVFETEFINLTVRGEINSPKELENVCTVVATVFDAEMTNIVAAVDVIMPNASALAYLKGDILPTVNNLFVDCGKKGNAVYIDYCRDDLSTGSEVTALGDAFAWNIAYNGGYPYLRFLPVLDDNRKYVLPNSGDFSADSYFVDDAGFPFPKVDFQPCKGVCYGVYNSPIARVCDDDFQYCLDVDKAKMEFPGDSCIADNAVCNAGASFCSSEAELLVVTATGEYACQKACPGCYNGYCSQAKCVCDVYNEGSTCTFNCRADEPNCFGNKLFVCDMQNASCILEPACENLTCVHGSCVDEPIAHCECDGLWVGDNCDRCKAGFDPATNCEKCRGAMEMIGGSCVCGYTGVVCENDYFCYSGSCYKGCMLLGKNCSKCDAARLDLCGGCNKGLVLSKGVCMAPKKVSAAAIAGGVIGGCVAIVAVGLVILLVLKGRKGSSKSLSKAEARAQPGKDQELKKVQIDVNEQREPLNAKQKSYTGSTSPRGLLSEAAGP